MKTTHPTTFPAILLAAVLALHPSDAHAATASELLEKGIYTEETKGDIEAAIAIYQQLVGEAKSSQSLAAQAQFRLGQCFLKKNRQNDAMAAFEKLIRDFPEEKELAAKAREHLPGDLALGPVPWLDGERLQFSLKLAGGMEIGTMEMRADLVDGEDGKLWRVGRRMSGGGEMLSSVDVDPEKFQPVASYWKHTLLGEVSATFKAGEVQITRVGTAEPTVVRPDKAVFDNEEVMHMMRRLPLQVGYKTSIPIITTLGGGTLMPIALEVKAKETVETPVGKFECFKVPLEIGQTFWISDDEHRYLVKFEAGGAIATLTSVTQRKAGTPIAFRDDTLGVTFTAPADWVIHRQSGERKGRTSIHLLDAAADAEHIALHLTATDSLAAAVRQSPRAWADHDLRENYAKGHQDFKVRADSWKTYNVAGRPGIGCVADYVKDGKAHVLFGLYALGPKVGETFLLSCSAEEFETLRPDLERIIASYRTTK